MSRARRETKCRMDSWTCAGQEAFTQRTATSPGTRTTFSPHAGQRRRQREERRPFRPLLEEDARHFRDHVARLLDGHGVAHTHVLAREVLEIVERGASDDRAREKDGRELGDGRQDPVRPTCTTISVTVVVASSAGTCTRSPSAGLSRSDRGASGRPRRPPSRRRRPSRKAGRGASCAIPRGRRGSPPRR